MLLRFTANHFALPQRYLLTMEAENNYSQIVGGAIASSDQRISSIGRTKTIPRNLPNGKHSNLSRSADPSQYHRSICQLFRVGIDIKSAKLNINPCNVRPHNMVGGDLRIWPNVSKSDKRCSTGHRIKGELYPKKRTVPRETNQEHTK